MEAGTLETRQPTMEIGPRNEHYPYAELVPGSLWYRLTGRLEKEGMNNELAQRTMNEALGFLKACADNPGVALSPSEQVDAGWHNFVLYTRDYAEFCEQEAGYFIHHEPSDNPLAEESGPQTLTVSETYSFLSDNGYQVDEELWTISSQGFGDQRCSSNCRNTCNNLT